MGIFRIHPSLSFIGTREESYAVCFGYRYGWRLLFGEVFGTDTPFFIRRIGISFQIIFYPITAGSHESIKVHNPLFHRVVSGWLVSGGCVIGSSSLPPLTYVLVGNWL